MPSSSAPENIDLKDFDPHDVKFISNPYPVYAWLRENQPVLKVARGYNSHWVFRHEDVQSILGNPDLWVKELESSSRTPKLRKSLFASDGRRHGDLRKLLAPLFIESITDIRETAIDIANQLVSDISPGQDFDLIAAYAHPLPSLVLAHVLGIRKQTRGAIESLGEKVIRANDPSGGFMVKGEGAAAMIALRAGLVALLDVPKEIKSGSMIDLMNRLAKSPQGLESDFGMQDVSANAASLAIAGYFTTTHLIGTGLTNLLDHPENLDAIREAIAANRQGPMLQKVASEMLRYDPPIHVLDRFASETTRVAGVTIEKGQKVGAVIGSANRDGKVFDDPDRFDIHRDTGGLLSFGFGVHQCLGAQLLRQVLPIALETLLTKRPQLQIVSPAVMQKDPYFRGYQALVLRSN